MVTGDGWGASAPIRLKPWGPAAEVPIPRAPSRRTPFAMRRSLRYTGVVAVIAVWTTLLAATARTGFDLLGEEPLSYLGTEPRSAGLFTLGLAVPAVLLTAFHQHLRRRFPVSSGFSFAMLAGLAGQMVAAFVPIGGDPAVHRVHTTSALVLGASLPLLMWRFAAGQPAGPWRRLSYAFFWSELAGCVAGIYLSAQMVAPLAEILPGAVFHAWVFTVTFSARPVVPPRSKVALPSPSRGREAPDRATLSGAAVVAADRPGGRRPRDDYPAARAVSDSRRGPRGGRACCPCPSTPS